MVAKLRQLFPGHSKAAGIPLANLQCSVALLPKYILEEARHYTGDSPEESRPLWNALERVAAILPPSLVDRASRLVASLVVGVLPDSYLNYVYRDKPSEETRHQANRFS